MDLSKYRDAFEKMDYDSTAGLKVKIKSIADFATKLNQH